MRISPKTLTLPLGLLIGFAALVSLPQATLAANIELSLSAALADIEAVTKAYPDGVPASEVRALISRVAPAVKAYNPPPPACRPPFVGCTGYLSAPSQPHPAARAEVALVETLKALAKDAAVPGAHVPASRLATVAAGLRALP